MEKQGSTEVEDRKSSAKIYFFIIAIMTLLGTNIYYAIQYKDLGKQVEVLYNEKNQLQAEIDRVEAELNRVSYNDAVLQLSPALMDERDNVRARISTLRLRLNDNQINQDEIYTAREEVYRLRSLVSDYGNEVKALLKENAVLNSEKQELTQAFNSSQQAVTSLEGENDKLAKENSSLSALNSALAKKVANAAILRISGISVNGVRIRNNGKESSETRARRADRLKVDFSIAANDLAPKGIHNVFLRVIDPSGNLLSDNSKFFKADNRRMQYTDKQTIRFLNDGKEYSLDWQPKKGLRKGTYVVVLYANGYTMGRGSVSLK